MNVGSTDTGYTRLGSRSQFGSTATVSHQSEPAFSSVYTPPVIAGAVSPLPAESHVSIGGSTIFAAPALSARVTDPFFSSFGVRSPVVSLNFHDDRPSAGSRLSLIVSFTAPGVTS